MNQDNHSRAHFFVAALEPGVENPALPAWGNHQPNPAKLSNDFDIAQVKRRELAQVPGAFQLFNVLSKAECKRLIDIS